MMTAMNPTVDLQGMDEAQMRQMLQALLSQVEQQGAVVQQQATGSGTSRHCSTSSQPSRCR